MAPPLGVTMRRRGHSHEGAPCHVHLVVRGERTKGNRCMYPAARGGREGGREGSWKEGSPLRAQQGFPHRFLSGPAVIEDHPCLLVSAQKRATGSPRVYFDVFD